ncbi:hypothetical protein ACIPJS_16800 [Streptomyces sp. NPDC086783]|jgi:hypothetical protein|uniref:hypothetical protein n=1 Tax=Streptomyces sp. NPDC086783 TaxID=3365758 RepID=UPI003827B67D
MTGQSNAAGGPGTGVCPHCGWPDDAEPFQVLSRHATANGRTVWARCGCGSLQMRTVDAFGTRVVSRGRPAATDADRPREAPADSTARRVSHRPV